MGPDFDWTAMDAAQITITWPIGDATTDPTSKVDVKLFGYSQTSSVSREKKKLFNIIMFTYWY
jgi:hypothetical protein